MQLGASLWISGWTLVLIGFASGALLGLGFGREAFLGGYASWRRRLVRLAHIACVMLGVLQMLVALSPAADERGRLATACWIAWRVGSFAMPFTCLLAAWRPKLRHLFAVPVACLLAAAGATLALIVKRGSS